MYFSYFFLRWHFMVISAFGHPNCSCTVHKPHMDIYKAECVPCGPWMNAEWPLFFCSNQSMNGLTFESSKSIWDNAQWETELHSHHFWVVIATRSRRSSSRKISCASSEDLQATPTIRHSLSTSESIQHKNLRTTNVRLTNSWTRRTDGQYKVSGCFWEKIDVSLKV